MSALSLIGKKIAKYFHIGMLGIISLNVSHSFYILVDPAIGKERRRP